MTRVLVTGATGLVGSHLVERLVERGDVVRALCRPGSDISVLQEMGVEIVTGDLLAQPSLHCAVRDVQIVYHCAARPPLGGSLSEFRRDNVLGTENLLRAALRENISRFVHVSTVDVYGYKDHIGSDESVPLIPDGPYSRSKIESERVVFDYFQKHDLPVVILRPCLIHGPFDRHLLPTVLTLLSLNRPPLVDGGRCLHDLIYAGDVADAMILAAERKAVIGQCFNISSGQRKTTREILQLAANISGKSSRFLNVPYGITYGASRLAEPLSRVFKFKIPAYARWEVIKAMAHNRHFDISKARQELGYQPQMGLEEGLRLSWEWYCGKRSTALTRSTGN